MLERRRGEEEGGRRRGEGGGRGRGGEGEKGGGGGEECVDSPFLKQKRLFFCRKKILKGEVRRGRGERKEEGKEKRKGRRKRKKEREEEGRK